MRLDWNIGLTALLIATLLSCDDPGSSKPTQVGTQLKDSGRLAGDIIDAIDNAPRNCLQAVPAGLAQVRSPCDMQVSDSTYLGVLETDLFIENSAARYVIRLGNDAGLMIMGSGPGGVVDAIPAVDGLYRPDSDRLMEFIPFPGLKTMGATKATYGQNENGSAYISLEARLTPVPIVYEALPMLGVEGIASMTWTLRPDSPVLELDIIVTPDSVETVDAGVALVLMHSGSLNGFIPGTGFDKEPAGTSKMIAGTRDGYSVGFKSETSMSFLEIGGLTLLLPNGIKAKNDTPAENRFFFAVTEKSVDTLVALLEGTDRYAASLVVKTNSKPTYPNEELVLEYGLENEAAIGRISLDDDGRGTLNLPPGKYWYTLSWREGPKGKQKELQVGTRNTNVTVEAPTVGLLSLRASDLSNDGVITPARAIISSDYLSYNLTTPIYPWKPTEILLPPGTYSLIVMRGHEYDAFHQEEIEIKENEETEVVAKLNRVVDTSGWIAADFHLHCEFSADSSLRIERRVLEVAAEGLEFAVSTDHDFVASYGPSRDSLGLSEFLAVEDGVEASHPTLAHITSWPIKPNPGLSGRGAPNWIAMTPGEIFHMLGNGSSERAFQLNHARSTSGYFTRTGYDPVTGEAQKSATALGYEKDTQLAGFNYDSMEVYNGKRATEFDELFSDWLSLLAQGFRVAATGTSDSHDSGAYPGTARTYVWVGEGKDDPQTITSADILDGVKSAKTLVVGGPFTEIWLLDESRLPENAAMVSETLHEKSEIARLRVRVQAPPWMPFDRIRIFHNQEMVIDEIFEGNPPGAEDIIRLDKIYELPVVGDSFFSAIACSASSASPYLKRAVKSMAGPVFLNADGTGSYDPPGLQDPGD